MRKVESLLFLFSIYLPLFITNIIIHKLNLISFSKEVETIEENYFKNNSYHKLLKAIKEGYEPTLFPAAWIKDGFKKNIYPLASQVYTNVTLCDEGYGLIKYKTDRFGLRNDDDKWNNLFNDEVKEISLFIGDSFVQGACVENKNTINNIFQSITKITSLNLGNGSGDPANYNQTLKQFVKPIVSKTDKTFNVFIIFYPNDNILFKGESEESKIKFIEPLDFKDKNITFKKDYLSSIENIFNKNKISAEDLQRKFMEDRKDLSLLEISKRYIFLSYLRHYFAHISGIPFQIDYSENSISAKSISTLKDVCQSKKCNPYVAFLPHSDYWRPDKRAMKYKQHLIKFAKKNNIKFLDLTKAFDQKEKVNFAPYGPHYSNLGYQKVGKYLSEIFIRYK